MLKRVAIPSALLASVAAAAAGLAPQAYQDQAYQGPYAPPPAPPVPAPAAAPVYTPVPYDPVRQSLAEWNRLRQSDAYDFADYARFMTAHPGWPGESSMRSTAERRLAAMAAAPSVVVNYFTRFPPRTATGHARYAEALAATGRVVEAQAAAVTAWTTGSLPPDVEVGLQTRFGQSFTVVDHDRRMEALLWAKATAPAMRQLTLTSPERRALYLARLALQANQPGAGRRRPELRSRSRAMSWIARTGCAMAGRARPRAPISRPADAGGIGL
jgi:soluble lytic murein transglycosylase